MSGAANVSNFAHQIKERSHASSIRRKLLALGSLRPTNESMQITDDNYAPFCTDLAFTHPTMCATGIPDMGGGLGVVAVLPPHFASPSGQQWIKASTPIMRVPSRALVTGKSSRRWLYQIGREAVEVGELSSSFSASPFPLLVQCLMPYFSLQNEKGVTAEKPNELSVVPFPPSSSTCQPISKDKDAFLYRLECWLLSLTSIQCIALYLFLMKSMPPAASATNAANSTSDNVISEDPQRHELLWEWVQNLPPNYDNLLELDMGDDSIQNCIWSPACASKAKLEIDNWRSLFATTMMDTFSGESKEAPNQPKASSERSEPSRATAKKAKLESSDLETESDSDDVCAIRQRGSGYLSLADMLTDLFGLRPDLYNAMTSRLGREGGSESLIVAKNITLAVPPRDFLWAYNSLMSRGFACDDETWVMMPYVDYFNYGIQEDAEDETVGARMVAQSKEVASTASSSWLVVENPKERSLPHLCTNIAVHDVTPRPHELLKWIRGSNSNSYKALLDRTQDGNNEGAESSEDIDDDNDNVSGEGPTLREVERLLSWAASEHSVCSRMWTQGKIGKNSLRGEYLRKRVPIKGQPSVSSSSSLASWMTYKVTSSSSTATPWLKEAQQLLEATATIVPSYNPLTVCEFTTTADVPLTTESNSRESGRQLAKAMDSSDANSVQEMVSPDASPLPNATSNSAGPVYHQFLLCYGTYMDFELALWYGFSLTDSLTGAIAVPDVKRLGTEGLVQQTQENALLAADSLFESSFPTPPCQPLLRHHIANSYSFSPLGNALGDYPKTRAEQGYALFCRRFVEGLYTTQNPSTNVDPIPTDAVAALVSSSLADFKSKFQPSGVSGVNGHFVMQPLSKASGLHRHCGFGAGSRPEKQFVSPSERTSPPPGRTASRLPTPPVFLSATADLYRNYHSGKGDLRISKAGCSTDILQACEHVAIAHDRLLGQHPTSQLPKDLKLPNSVLVDAAFWHALQHYAKDTARLDLNTPTSPVQQSLVEAFIERLATYQRVFLSRNVSYLQQQNQETKGGGHAHDPNAKKAPAAKRVREGCDADVESDDRTIGAVVSVPIEELLRYAQLGLAEMAKNRLQKPPQTHLESKDKSKSGRKREAESNFWDVSLTVGPSAVSVLRVAMALQLSLFGEWQRLESARNKMCAGTNSTASGGSTDPQTLAGHFGLQSSIAQWALLRDLGNVAKVAADAPAVPIMSLEHLLKLLYLCYDGRGGCDT